MDEASWTKFVSMLCSTPLEFSELIYKKGQWFAILLLLSSMPDAGMPSLVAFQRWSHPYWHHR